MSYDELLEKLDRTTGYISERLVWGNYWHKALRAVVELHKPIEMKMPYGAIYCMGCGRDHEFNEYWIEYPCPTIQAIEKELQ